jgi:hypothetical protein
MQTVRIYKLTHLSPTMFGRHKAAQMAMSKERGRVVLPIGRGRASIVLPLDLPEHSGACTLVWNRGFELHVCIEVHKPSMPLARTGPRWIWGRSTPHGMRQENKGRYHNQRMAQWEYGRDIDYLTHKSTQACIESFTGSERGTSSQCPVCRHKRQAPPHSMRRLVKRTDLPSGNQRG